jgi:HNH/ENDO VII superfamily nuclease
MALLGSSTALGNAITAANGGVEPNGGIPDQAHHLLSSSVVIELDYEYRSRAKKLMANASGYQLNAASNGILLPTHFGHQRKLDLQRHRGNHYNVYYENVRNELRPIYDKFETLNVCTEPTKSKFLACFTDSEKAVRANIKNRDWWLYDWSKKLWDGDYRDEGTGNLALSRPPFTSQETGLQWLTDKAGDIKRRYTTVIVGSTKRNIVNTKWYTSHTYPAPGSIY